MKPGNHAPWRAHTLAVCVLGAAILSAGLAKAEDAPSWPINAKFSRLTTEEGLSNADVRAIAQDREGFMWFGTTLGGINRYDGYELRQYLHDNSDPRSLSFNFIWTLFIDKEGVLWAGTNGGGLDRFDRKTGTFEHFRHDPSNPRSLPNNTVLSLLEDRAGHLWVGTRGGISRMDRRTGSFETFRQAPTEFTANINSIRCMVEDPATGILWLGTSDALSAFDPESARFQNYVIRGQGNAGAAMNAINCIVLDDAGFLWTMTEVGLRRFKPNLKSIALSAPLEVRPEFETFTHDPNNPESLSHDFLRWGILDRKGRLWLASQNGLNILNRDTLKFQRLHKIPGDPDSLSDNTVHKVFEDSRGTIWVGSIYGGVSKLRSEDKDFVTYRRQLENPNSLGHDSVTALCIARDNKLWVGTAEGLSSFDGRNWTRYRHDPSKPGSLSGDAITTVTEDTRGRIWVGTYNSGINILEGDRFLNPIRKSSDPLQAGRYNRYSGMQVNSFLLDERGGMWVGARAYGLDHFDGAGFLHYPPVQADGGRVPSDMAVLGAVDGKGNIWYGTEQQGLVCFDPARENFRRYLINPSDPDSELNKGMYSTYNDGKGSLWVSSFNGLLRFDLASERFIRRYSVENGLPSSSVVSMLEDDKGLFWLSTPKGIVRFDPVKESFRLYDKGDGLPSNQFSIRAASKARDGRLYFGSVAGVVAFYPDRLKENLVPPNVVLTGFELQDKAIDIADSISLRHDESVFTIKFAALDFSAPEKNRYAYMMEPFDKDWRHTNASRRLASYTNLPPGDYLFRVKGTNNDGVWSKNEARIRISITPPWWQTLWARIVLVVGSAAAFLAAFTWRIRKIQRRNAELTEQIEVRRRIEATVRASEERFRALYDDNPAIYLTVDSAGGVLSINRFGAEMLGRQADQVAGQSVGRILNREDAPLFQRHFDACLASLGKTERWEQRLQRADGSMLWVRSSARALQYPDGSKVVLLVCEDISDKVNLEENLRQMQKIEALGQLAGGVAHDFNNILTVILTQAAWAESEDSTPEEKAEATREIREAGRRAANLTRQLLIFSRRESVKRSALDLNDVIMGITKMIRRLIGEHIVLETTLSPRPARIFADAGMIEQVLVNMAVNARDAMPAGGTLTITTKEFIVDEQKRLQQPKAAAGDYLCMEISDTGVGMPPEVIARLFQPFFTTKAAGKGTGLGLTTSLGIIQQHEGWIEVDSKPGKGTCFRVVLPKMTTKAAADLKSAQSHSFTLSGETILLVEDDQEVRRSARLVLERTGHRVLEACDASSALEVWSEHKDEIQMVMSDIVMPGELNGRELVLKLLSLQPQLKVGLMSGYDPGEAGCDVHADPRIPSTLQKPVTADELLAYVRKCLRS